MREVPESYCVIPAVLAEPVGTEAFEVPFPEMFVGAAGTAF